MYLLLEFEDQNLEQDKKNFYDFLSKKDENFMLGAIYNGKIIASVGISVKLGIKKTRHVGNWGISIHPDFHNQGLGTRLLMIMEKIAKESGLKKLEAEFFEGNKISEHLYVKKLGYKIEGRRKYAALLKDNTYVDRILIGKIINESLKGKK